MTGEWLAYPFIFLGIFFESFMLVTFLSRPARVARDRKISGSTPRVALIVPCYNEEDTIARTIDSVLKVDYPKNLLEIILVDDGSKDRTREIMEQYRSHPQIKIIFKKENGGKHTALNAGIAATSAEIVGCLDADTTLEPDAIRRTLVCFDTPNVAAAMSSISIAKPCGILQRMQSAEYTMGMFYKHALCSINAMYVTPGPFSLYRRSVLEKVGDFTFGQQTEDMEMALRLQREGYEIDNMPRALVSTHAMDTFPKLMRQRMRWTSGFLRNVLFDYRDLFSSKYGPLGLLILPFGLITPVAIVSLFALFLYRTIHALAMAYIVRQGMPLSWHLWPAFHAAWFYAPISVLTLLAAVTFSLGVTMMVVGKRVSRAPVNLFSDALSYLLLYSFVAPIWYFRATADVVLGKRRGWR